MEIGTSIFCSFAHAIENRFRKLRQFTPKTIDQAAIDLNQINPSNNPNSLNNTQNKLQKHFQYLSNNSPTGSGPDLTSLDPRTVRTGLGLDQQ